MFLLYSQLKSYEYYRAGIEISKSTYAKLETNRMNIKVSELIALSKIFHADIKEFFDGLL